MSAKTGKNISQLIIYTPTFKDYVFFWAEQNTHLELKNGAFKKAVITGSKTQTEKEEYVKQLGPNRMLQDSLLRLLNASKDDAKKKCYGRTFGKQKNRKSRLKLLLFETIQAR
ncbi:hypothetical protein [Pedobacter sp.]|uniref:hypothetical protein n=1 Tax=Pedobacter sp. TaxID=1411316 RepID=UPI003BAD7F7F